MYAYAFNFTYIRVNIYKYTVHIRVNTAWRTNRWEKSGKKDIPLHRNWIEVCDFTLKILHLQILYNYTAFFETHMPP